MNIPPSVTSFFASYAAAFNALDGASVAEHYAVPSSIASDSGHVHWPNKEPIVANMVALCEQYRSKGFVSTAFDIVQFIAQGDNFAVADLNWIVGWNQGQGEWSFNTTYNLMKVAGAWKILLCTAYSETKLPSVP